MTSSERLRRIADVAEKHNIPMVKLTGGQRIDLLRPPKEDLPKGLGQPRYAVRLRIRQEFGTVKTCVGQEFWPRRCLAVDQHPQELRMTSSISKISWRSGRSGSSTARTAALAISRTG